MAMNRDPERAAADPERAAASAVGVAVLAKAPVPGLAKTRLVPVLGAEGAARLAGRFIERALATATR
jgi:glycosyltransferase A (GT-A) superfamily protein (DUF2064 family)